MMRWKRFANGQQFADRRFCWLTRPRTTPGRILSITVARGVQAASESRVMLKQRVRWSRARRWSRVMHRVMHGGGAEQSRVMPEQASPGWRLRNQPMCRAPPTAINTLPHLCRVCNPSQQTNTVHFHQSSTPMTLKNQLQIRLIPTRRH